MNISHEHPDKIRRVLPRFLFGSLCMLALLSGWLLSKSTPTLAEARAEFKNGNIVQAEAILNQILKSQPQNTDGWFLLGKCLENRSQFSAAADAYSRSLGPDSKSWASLSLLAATLLKSARLEEAEAVYRKLIAIKPTDEQVRTELQWLLFNQSRTRELEDFLESCLAREPDNFQILFHLIYSSQRPPNPRETVGKMEMVERLQPGQSSIQLALGHCYWKLGDVEKARTYLTKAHSVSPHSIERSLLLAEFLIEQGEAQLAAKLLVPPDRHQEEWRKDDRWWWLKGNGELQAGNLNEALKSIHRAAQLRPSEGRYIVQEVALLRSTGKAEQATSLSQALQKQQAAERELYISVSRGDLNNPTPEMCQKISEICTVLSRDKQAWGWKLIANSATSSAL